MQGSGNVVADAVQIHLKDRDDLGFASWLHIDHQEIGSLHDLKQAITGTSLALGAVTRFPQVVMGQIIDQGLPIKGAEWIDGRNCQQHAIAGVAQAAGLAWLQGNDLGAGQVVV